PKAPNPRASEPPTSLHESKPPTKQAPQTGTPEQSTKARNGQTASPNGPGRPLSGRPGEVGRILACRPGSLGGRARGPAASHDGSERLVLALPKRVLDGARGAR